MPYSVIGFYGLPPGPVGSISQTDFPLVSPRQVNPTDTNSIAFGETMVLNPNNTYSSVKEYIARNGVAAFLAMLMQEPTYPIAIAKDAVETNAYYPLNGGTNMPLGSCAPGMMVNGLTRGTIWVTAIAGWPGVANTPVYIRTALDSAVPAGVVGGIEAVPDPNATVVGTANTGNTGNGTIGTLSLLSLGKNGTYTVSFTSATAYNVYDPSGALVGTGATGTAFNAGNQIQFTITAGGTAFAKGDGFSIVVTSKTVVIPNIVFKTGRVDQGPNGGELMAQVTILRRRVA